MGDSDYESVLLVKREVFLYTLPPRQSVKGCRAADWSLDSPAWTGRLRVITKGTSNTLYLRLEDGTSGRLYAQCPVESFPSEAVEQVLDSSRYFVIRLVSDDGRSVLVGIGFTERSDAFDLNVTIQDHFKHAKQAAEAERIQAEEALAGGNVSNQPKLDLGLKEGQRLRLNIKTRRPGGTSNESSGSGRSRPLPSLKLGDPTGGMPGLIPPPPSSASSGSRNRPALRSQVMPGAAAASVTGSSSTSSTQSNVELLAGIFQSAPPPEQTSVSAGASASFNAQNANDFSLI